LKEDNTLIALPRTSISIEHSKYPFPRETSWELCETKRACS